MSEQEPGYGHILTALRDNGIGAVEVDFSANEAAVKVMKIHGFQLGKIERFSSIVPDRSVPDFRAAADLTGSQITIVQNGLHRMIREESGHAVGKPEALAELVSEPIEDVYATLREGVTVSGTLIIDVENETIEMSRGHATWSTPRDLEWEPGDDPFLAGD